MLLKEVRYPDQDLLHEDQTNEDGTDHQHPSALVRPLSSRRSARSDDPCSADSGSFSSPAASLLERSPHGLCRGSLPSWTTYSPGGADARSSGAVRECLRCLHTGPHAS